MNIVERLSVEFVTFDFREREIENEHHYFGSYS